VVQRALRLIEQGYLDNNSVDELAAVVGIGPRHLHRLFIQHVGASPLTVAQTRRIHFAKRLLDDTRLPITEIALASGFGSLRRFNSAFQETYQRAPRDFRRRKHVGALSAGDEVVLKLAFRPPYDWAQVRDFLAKRAIPGIERIEGNEYARTVAHGDKVGIIRVSPSDQEDALEFRVQGAESSSLFEFSYGVRRMFDLAADPARIGGVLGSDPLLAPLVKNHPGLRIPGTWDPFECAVRAIVGQQISVAGARTLLARLVTRTGRPIADSSSDLTHTFPTPGDLASAKLDGLGLTSARVHALKSIAGAIVKGELDFGEPAEAVLAKLGELPGIGEWTAQYIALRGLNEPDALPSGDLVLRRIVGSGGEPLSLSGVQEHAEGWRPWRSYAVMYLWCFAGENTSPTTLRGRCSPQGRRNRFRE